MEKSTRYLNFKETIRGIKTILEPTKNNKLASDNGYGIKLPIFQSSKYAITSKIDSQDWNVNAIKSRQAKLAKLACGRWKIQF